MIFHPLFVVLNTFLGSLETLVGYVGSFAADLPTIEIPWPFPWLPTWPVVTAIATGTFTALFFLTIKLTRWVYGLVPFAQ